MLRCIRGRPVARVLRFARREVQESGAFIGGDAARSDRVRYETFCALALEAERTKRLRKPRLELKREDRSVDFFRSLEKCCFQSFRVEPSRLYGGLLARDEARFEQFVIARISDTSTAALCGVAQIDPKLVVEHHKLLCSAALTKRTARAWTLQWLRELDKSTLKAAESDASEKNLLLLEQGVKFAQQSPAAMEEFQKALLSLVQLPWWPFETKLASTKQMIRILKCHALVGVSLKSRKLYQLSRLIGPFDGAGRTELVDALWSIGELRLYIDSQAARDWSSRFSGLAADCSSRELAHALAGMVGLRVPPVTAHEFLKSGVVDEIVLAFLQKLEDAAPDELSVFIFALGELRYDRLDAMQFDRWSAAMFPDDSDAKLGVLSPIQHSRLLLGIARLGHNLRPAAFDSWHFWFSRSINSLSARELGSALWAVGALNFTLDAASLTRSELALVSQVGELSAPDLNLVLQSLVVLDHQVSPASFYALCDGMLRVMHEFSPKELADVMIAVAMMGRTMDSVLFAAWKEKIIFRMHDLDRARVTGILWAMMSMSIKPYGGFYRRWQLEFLKHVDKMSAAELAANFYLMSKVSRALISSEIIEAFRRMFTQRSREFSAKDLVQIVKALAAFHSYKDLGWDDQLMLEWEQLAMLASGDFVQTEIKDVLHATSTLGRNHELPLYQELRYTLRQLQLEQGRREETVDDDSDDAQEETEEIE